MNTYLGESASSRMYMVWQTDFGGGGISGRRPRQDADGASRDLIEMLPTCKYSSASAPPKPLGKFLSHWSLKHAVDDVDLPWCTVYGNSSRKGEPLGRNAIDSARP